MRYFFIIYLLVSILVVSIGGLRGDKFKNTPIRIFPDMDEQDRIDPQEASDFFADGLGSRQPVAETIPQGLKPDPIPDTLKESFANDNSYYHSGMFNDKVYGNGLPVEELGLTEENLPAFIERGAVVYNANCSACHGISGNGKGVVAAYGVPGVINLVDSQLPDGGKYDVIVNGRGNMSAFGYQVDLDDRWAIIAYLRAIQYSRKVPLELVKQAYEEGTAKQ